MTLHLSHHPIVLDCLARLRDEGTEPEQFRLIARRAGTLLLYEVTRDLPVRPRSVRRESGVLDGFELDCEVVLVPVLRAGIGLLAPALELLPGSRVGAIGMERDSRTGETRMYVAELPDLTDRLLLLLEPMIGTGESMLRAIDLALRAGARDIRVLCILASRAGIDAVESVFPAVRIYGAAVDDGLIDRAFVVPGLGDFGDRLFGTGQSAQ